MAKCEFYRIEDVLAICSELSKYANPTIWKEIGISSSRNIKLRNSSGQLKILTKDDVGRAIYKKVYDTCVGTALTGAQCAIPTGMMESMPIGELASLFGYDVFYGLSADTALIVSGTSLGYIRVTKKKHQVMTEYCAPDINSTTRPMYIDAIRLYTKDKSAFDSCAELYRKNKAWLEGSIKDLTVKCDDILQPAASVRFVRKGIALDVRMVVNDADKQELPCHAFNLFSDQLTDEAVIEKVRQCCDGAVTCYNGAKRLETARTLAETQDQSFLQELIKQYKLKNARIVKGNVVAESHNGTQVTTPTWFEHQLADNWYTENMIAPNGSAEYLATQEASKYSKEIGEQEAQKAAKIKWLVVDAAGMPRPGMKQVNDAYARYNKWTNKLMNGRAQRQPSVSKSYDISSGQLIVKSPLVTVTVDSSGKGKMLYASDFKDLEHDVSSKRYQQAEAFLREIFNVPKPEMPLPIKYVSGQGLLYGTTNVVYKDNGIDGLYFKWQTPAYSDGLTTWKEQAKKNWKELNDTIQKKLEERDKELKARLASFLDSYLAHDVAEFVLANEEYVTANATIDALRGLNQRLYANLEDTNGCGQYNLISKDEIQQLIRKMIGQGLFYTRTLRGTYGRFEILKVGELGSLLSMYTINEKVTSEDIVRAENSPVKSDWKAEQIFDHIRAKKDLAMTDYMTILNLIPAKGFVCKRYDDLISFMQDAPKEVRTLVTMKKTVEEDKYTHKVLVAMSKPKKKTEESA